MKIPGIIALKEKIQRKNTWVKVRCRIARTPESLDPLLLSRSGSSVGRGNGWTQNLTDQMQMQVLRAIVHKMVGTSLCEKGGGVLEEEALK